MKSIVTLQEHSIEIVNKAATKILKHTPQLFIYKNQEVKKKLQPFCSAVLFKTKTSHYMVTAHHCINQNGERIRIEVHTSDTKLYSLMDSITYASDGKNEKVDIALMKLTDISIKVLSENYSFLDYGEIWKASILEAQTEFIIVGHHQTGTKFDHHRKTMTQKPFVQVSHSANSYIYKNLQYNKNYNTLLQYNRRKSTFLGSGEMSMGPIPTGISGCGFWRVKDYTVIPDDVEVRLAGIMYLSLDDKNLLVACNSDLIENLLRKSEQRFGL